MKQFLLFLLLSITWASISQDHLYPAHLFEDYETCLTGIKNYKNEVIQPAIYTEIRRAESRVDGILASFWIAQKEESFGLFSYSGELILDAKYERIRHLYDSLFTLKENGVAHIKDLHGKTFSTPYDDIDIIDNHPRQWNNDFRSFQAESKPAFYCYSLQGKRGLLDSNFGILSPASYLSLNQLFYSYTQNSTFNDIYLDTAIRTTNHLGKMGLLKTNGETILPTVYEEIKPLTSFKKNGERSVYFYVTDSTGYSGLVDDTGELIIPMEFDEITPVSIYLDSIIETNSQSFIAKNEKGYFINTHTGKQVGPFQGAFGFGHYAIVKNKGSWSALDNELNYIVKNVKGQPSIYDRDMQGFEEDEHAGWYRSLEEYRYNYAQYIGLDHKFNVIFTCEPHTFEKDEPDEMYHYSYPYRVTKKGLRGMIDLKTGKSLPTNYSEITILEDSLKTVFYWGLLPVGKDSIQHIDVFNANLEIINQFTIDYMTLEQKRNGSYYGVNSRLHFLIKNDKLGAVDCTGATVIPFQFDHCYALFKRNQYGQLDGVKGYVLYIKQQENDGEQLDPTAAKHGIFSPSGKELFPVVYDLMYTSSKDEMVLKQGENYTILDPALNVRLSNCSFVIENNWYNSMSKHVRIPSLYNNSTQVLYAVRADTLYALLPDTTVIMNKRQYNYRSTVNTFAARIVVTENGYVPATTSSTVRQFNNKKGYCFLEANELTILDSLGTIIERVSGVLRIEYQCNEIMKVMLEGQRQCLYDMNELKWRFKTERPRLIEHMTTFLGGPSKRYWIKDVDSTGDMYNWQLVNAEETPLLNYTVDYPVLEFKHVMSRNGKFGLLNDQLEVVIPFEYDFIREMDDDYLVVKDSVWGCYINGKLRQPAYTAISTIDYKDLRFVFRGDQVGVLDANNNYLIELITSDSLIQHVDLQQIMDISTFETFYVLSGAIKQYPGMPDDYRVLSNRNILNYFTMHSTKHQVLGTTNYKLRPCGQNVAAPFSAVYSEAGESIEYFIRYANNGYYSVDKTSKFFSWNMGASYVFNHSMSRENYRIVNGELVPIVLEDLFSDKTSSDALLKHLITEILTEKQAFGLACINSEALFVRLKQGFTLEQNGIRFHDVSNDEKTILIPAAKLLPYLSDKEMFTVK